jgi:predicted metal-dependent peptidase
MGHKNTMEYAAVFMVGKYIVSDKVPTARTNGIDCEYGTAFIKDMVDSDLRGLIMHENLHKTFQHMFLWQHLYKEDGKTANMACDYVINLIIDDLKMATDMFVTLPKGGLLDERFRGMDSQTVYNILRDEKDANGNFGGDGDGEGGLDDHDCLDDHDWDSGKDMSQEEIE